jgi:hypothetical protein
MAMAVLDIDQWDVCDEAISESQVGLLHLSRTRHYLKSIFGVSKVSNISIISLSDIKLNSLCKRTGNKAGHLSRIPILDWILMCAAPSVLICFLAPNPGLTAGAISLSALRASRLLARLVNRS